MRSAPGFHDVTLPVGVEHEDGVVADALDQMAEARFRVGVRLHSCEFLFFESLALGEVTRDLGEADQLALGVEHARNDDVGPKARAVLADAPRLVFEPTLARGDLQLLFALAGFDVLLGEEAREMLANDLVGGEALDALRAGVPRGHLALGVEQVDGVVADALDQEAEARFRLGVRGLERAQTLSRFAIRDAQFEHARFVCAHVRPFPGHGALKHKHILVRCSRQAPARRALAG